METIAISPDIHRPLGSGLGLRAYGIEHRWVIIDGPAGQGTAALLEMVREELAAHIARLCPSLAGELAEELAEDVQTTHSPGPSLRALLADPEMPEAARFGLYMADRVLRNREAINLLHDHPLVVQGRGALSTYAYQVVGGGVSMSLFAQMSIALAPERADLLIVLSPSQSGGDRTLEAYCNPPPDVLKLCARRFAFISTEGRDLRSTARRCVEAIAGGTLSFSL
jgi:thymidylate kinase